jgi:hypothetical protein
MFLIKFLSHSKKYFNMKKMLFIALTAMLMIACKKDKTVDTPPISSTADFYFVGQVDGKPLKFEISNTSVAESGIFNTGGINVPDCWFTYGAGIGTQLGESDEKSIEIDFLTFFDGKCSDQENMFPNLFPLKQYIIGENKGNVEIIYFAEGEKWSSSNPLQKNARFEITASEYIKPLDRKGIQFLSGKLSCSLFNADGKEKRLENASFTLIFEAY